MPPLSGGLMQLVAYGAQDIYLTGNPSITFFKATYRRDIVGIESTYMKEQERVEFRDTKLKLPEFKFMKDGKLELITEEFDIEEFIIDEEDRECCICLNDYKEGDVIKLLECRHHMHKECINEWFTENNSCPTCRNIAFGVEI